MSTRGESARNLFLQGYTCAQAVVLAFEDMTGLDRATAARLASGFGGGMGRMREVCGAVSGGVMVVGMVTGLDTLVPEEKNKLYALEREFAEMFKSKAGSYICRELVCVHI